MNSKIILINLFFLLIVPCQSFHVVIACRILKFQGQTLLSVMKMCIKVYGIARN